MQPRTLIALLTIWFSFIPIMGLAAQLSVDPILLEINAPAMASALRLRNGEQTPAYAQTRVFRWRQVSGKDSFEPTDDVQVSPPIVRLEPGADYTVRVVRTSHAPIVGEESYRVFVDQLPDNRQPNSIGIKVLIRQSIPVFFHGGTVSNPDLTWEVRRERSAVIVTAKNVGDMRLRLADLRLRDRSGAAVNFGDGLNGYVLGRSTMTFTATSPSRDFGASGPIEITAKSNAGPVHASATISKQR